MFKTFEISGFQTYLYDDGESLDPCPLFLLFAMDDDSAFSLFKRMEEIHKDVALAIIILPNWDSYMIPFPSKEVKAVPKASELSQEIPYILNRIVSECAVSISHRYLIGYSLGGLFAVYEGLNGYFDGIASVSGSMWYPGILDYALTKKFPESLKLAYFSIGKQESGKANSLFSKAQPCMLEMVELFRKKGVGTHFEYSEGGHFNNAEERLLKAISYLLNAV